MKKYKCTQPGGRLRTCQKRGGRGGGGAVSGPHGLRQGKRLISGRRSTGRCGPAQVQTLRPQPEEEKYCRARQTARSSRSPMMPGVDTACFCGVGNWQAWPRWSGWVAGWLAEGTDWQVCWLANWLSRLTGWLSELADWLADCWAIKSYN
mgnify:CR=1 FL=1